MSGQEEALLQQARIEALEADNVAHRKNWEASAIAAERAEHALAAERELNQAHLIEAEQRIAAAESQLRAEREKAARYREALERIAKHPGGTAKKSAGIDWCRNEARAALAALRATEAKP